MAIDQKQMDQLRRRVGPEAERFAEYLCGEFWARCETTALTMGCPAPEARVIAQVVTAAAAKAMAGMTLHVRRLHDRGLHG